MLNSSFFEEDGIVYAEKKGNGALTVKASSHAIVIAHCIEGGQQGVCNEAVDKVVEYLKTQAY